MCEECDVVDIREWPKPYFNDFEFQNLSDREIIEELINVRKVHIEDIKEPGEIIDVPYATEVFYSLEVAFKLL